MDINLVLLQAIHKNASIGVSSLPHVLSLPQSRAMVPALQAQLRAYRTIVAQSQSYARHAGFTLSPPDSTALAVASAVLRIQSWLNPTTTRLAETVIQDNTSGTVQITRLLHRMDRQADPLLLSLGRSLVDIQDESTHHMRNFL